MTHAAATLPLPPPLMSTTAFSEKHFQASSLCFPASRAPIVSGANAPRARLISQKPDEMKHPAATAERGAAGRQVESWVINKEDLEALETKGTFPLSIPSCSKNAF